eukprot:CAMPEP_0178929998 /NCGR_PEP_ID=MMETSP0786-20121207/20968_1 /TAXON_ID=186022 /ORGANISM="Thalassionema frauenfeldii, Strain CCMP 1798" /LENGTH=636 /DNA_ID=CAMNT_0020606431 /DNA_START=29 /DNA_END=1936 /DNA_ORIENTATION=-
MKRILILLICNVTLPIQAFQYNSFSLRFDPKAVENGKLGSSLFVKNDQDTLENELYKTKDALTRLDSLEAAIREEESDLSELTEEVKSVEEHLNNLSNAPLPPEGLSMSEYKQSVLAYAKLPVSLKFGLYIALGMNTDASPYPKASDYAEIVSQLYEKRQIITIKKLEDSVKEAQKLLKMRDSNGTVLKSGNMNDLDEETEKVISELLDGKNVDQVRNDNAVKQQLGRVTRKDGMTATKDDAEILLEALKDKNIFVVRGQPEEIPGGYILRGTSRKEDANDLISEIDKKLPSNWKAQVSYMPDMTLEGMLGDFDVPTEQLKDPDPVLVVLNKDFSTQSGWIFQLSSIIAITTTLYFAVQCYAGDTDLASRLVETGNLGDFTVLDQFNGQLLLILAPLAIIQIFHELGHFAISKRDKFETGMPTLLPMFGPLPNLGFRTDLKTSPRNLTSLFDFAFIGPFLGLFAAFSCLAYGLLATVSSTPEMLQGYPALSVSELRCSTLASSIVDYFFGGNGAVTSGSLDTAVKLHPFAVAGFAGVIIQALELLPFGSTDGGRMSLALFGRSGNVVVGGTTWFAFLIATLFLNSTTADFLLGVWIINNFAQNDMEIPCRDETANVDIVRSIAGLSLWFIAILALV